MGAAAASANEGAENTSFRSPGGGVEEGHLPAVRVRYWAAARSAAGTGQDLLTFAAPTTLAEVLAAVRAKHADRPRLSEVLSVCSALVADEPVGNRDACEVVVRPGDTVELLPPFAGGAG